MADRAHGEVIRPFERPAPIGDKCPQCGRWRLDREDLYCGLCGVSLFGVSLRPDRVILISGMGETAASRRLVLENTTAESVSVQITPREREVPGLVLKPSRVDVPAGGTAGFEASLDEKKLAEDLFVVREEFFCRIDAHPRKVLSFRVEVKAGPRPEVLTREARFGRVVDGERGETVVRLANRGAVPLVIASVEAVGSAQLQVLDHPKRLEGGEEGRIQLAWDSSQAKDEVPGDVKLRVRFANYSGEVLIPTRVQLERLLLHVEPDVIRISPAIPKEPYERTLRLSNRGTLDVDVAAVGSDQDWIVVESLPEPLSLAVPEPGAARPGAGEAGETQRALRVRLDPTGLEPGKRKGEIWIRDLEGRAIRTVPVELDVVAAKPYHDYIGIDFGTTNSVVAYIDPLTEAISLVEIASAGKGRHPLIPSLIPSVLTFRSGPDDYVIGHEARDEMDTSSDRTVRSVKRLLGSGCHHEFFGQKFPPQAIAGRILKELVRLAESKLLERDAIYRIIERAIVTVPAGFFDLQIQAILDACEMAGLDTERQSRGRSATNDSSINTGIIIDEPSAAALYYLRHLQRVAIGEEILQMVKRRPRRGVHLLVFDYGGGTVDVSLAQLKPLKDERYGLVIRATLGDDRIGGDRIDLAILGMLLSRIDPDSGLDTELVSCSYRDLKRRAEEQEWPSLVLSEILRVRGSWKDLAERAKIDLSSSGADTTQVPVKGSDLIRIEGAQVAKCPKDIVLRLDLAAVEERVKDFMESAKALVARVLDAAQVKSTNVDFVLHTGRQSLMPAVRGAVRSIFPDLSDERDILEKNELKVCVAKGAAYYGLIKEAPGSTIQFLDQSRRLPYSYGFGVGQGAERRFLLILDRGATYPTEQFHELPASEIPANGIVNLRIYKNRGTVQQNRGTSPRIEGNPDIRLIGQGRIDTLADDEPGCTLRFAVAENRTLEVTADGQPVEIEDAPWEEDDGDWFW